MVCFVHDWSRSRRGRNQESAECLHVHVVVIAHLICKEPRLVTRPGAHERVFGMAEQRPVLERAEHEMQEASHKKKCTRGVAADHGFSPPASHMRIAPAAGAAGRAAATKPLWQEAALDLSPVLLAHGPLATENLQKQ
jgi:hypothetical protein